MGTAAHLLLVGIPGAGKSTVGRALAHRLRRPFLDLDADIEAHAGLRITEIFATLGEQKFREMERDATRRLAQSRTPMVVAPGGGWITVPGLVALLRPPSQLIWLQVSPSRALERLGSDVSSRPLLAGPDPLARMMALLAARESFYLQADHAVSVESMAPDAVVEAIIALAQHGPGD